MSEETRRREEEQRLEIALRALEVALEALTVTRKPPGRVPATVIEMPRRLAAGE